MAGKCGPDIIENGLVLALDAANKNSYPGSGTSWKDLSGNGNNGTLTNGPTFNVSNQGSITFDGTNDYIDIADSTSLNPTILSIESWFKITAFSSNQNIINKGYTFVSEPYISYTLKMDGVSSPYNTIAIEASVGGVRKALTSTTTLSANIWYNVVSTYDGSTFKLYINSIQESNTLSSTGTISSYNTPLQIGRWGTQGSQYFNGNIAIAKIYNRALTATEILQNYNATKSRFGY